MIRVLLVDDQQLVRQGIRGLLELIDGIRIVGEARDGVEAVELAVQLAPDVMLLDIRMPRLDGIGTLRALAAREQLPPTLVLTTFEDGDAAVAAIRAGAKGLMLKDVSLETLTAAIHALAAGGTAFEPAMTESLLAALGRQPLPDGESAASRAALTERERQVLHLICAGHANREIALVLGLAEGTVKNHVSNILSKLHARDRTHAVLKALQSGIMG